MTTPPEPRKKPPNPRGSTLSRIAFCLLAALSTQPAHAAATGPALEVNATQDRHPISPGIYGFAYGDPDLAKDLHLTVHRLGGDATTRYNWQVDASNSGDDWFFTCGNGQPNPTPSGSVDQWIRNNAADGCQSLLTIPVIGYINRSSAIDCSFPVSLFGLQQKVNPYVHPVVNGVQTDAGNGRKPDGAPILLSPADILRVNLVNTPDFQRGWVRHLIQKFGTAATGGVAIYEMDNEPSGWNNTHRDVHPDKTGYDELIGDTQPYAAMVKSLDPTAAVLGPGDFGWAVYEKGGKPGDDASSHHLGFAEYYLQQMRAYETRHNLRILDYFDEHYYPATNNGAQPLALSPAGNADTQALRLQSTRSLWDPAYVEKNWIGQWSGPINLIPRLHTWVDRNYPGTKLAITEYNFGGLESLNGALTEADVLGIFGRERLDLATLWDPPHSRQPGAFAFRMYRNYDGLGGQYGETWVRSTSADQGSLAIYGAERQKDGALTLMVINKTPVDLTSPLNLHGFAPAAAAAVYQYRASHLDAIVRAPDQPVKPTGFTATYPANSITLIVLPNG